MNQIALRKARVLLLLLFLTLSVVYVFWNRSDIVEIYANQIYRRVKYEEVNIASSDIQIVIVIGATTKLDIYKHALDTLKCYCAIHGYPLRIVLDNMFESNCTQKDKFFRRHCVVAHLLEDAEYTLFLDADVGVVNPKKKIQAFIEEGVEVVFYDRFYNQEVMAGSYLIKRSSWSYKFLIDFADYEQRLPNSFHGTDNGAIHAYLAELILPGRSYEYFFCMELYKISKNYDDLFAYEACIRSALGSQERFGFIKILEKGTGWARDNWLTNSKWNMDRDFMIHGWKLQQLRNVSYESMPLTIVEKSRSEWFNPLSGAIHLNLCTANNLTWSYDTRLFASTEEITDKLTSFRRQVDLDKFKKLAHLSNRMKVTQF